MSERKHNQLGLADSLVSHRRGLNEQLERAAGLIDWGSVEKVLAPLARSSRGAPGYGPLLLFKAVLLAQWHGLSDEAMEAALDDRLSFRRFCGLRLEDAVPDHSTLWRFREALGKAGLAQRAFAEIGRQLEKRGLLVKEGTLIDVSLIAAQARPPSIQEEPDPAPPGERPQSLLRRSELDPDAGWTRRGRRRVFGYKAHVGVDRHSGLIRAQILTGAEVNDTVMGDALIMGDEKAVYADKAYDTHARRAWLRAKGIEDCIQKRPNRHHPRLEPPDIERNKRIGRIRGRVETVWAFMKRIWRYDRVRYFNGSRNKVQFALLCIAYNLRRATVLA